MNRWLIVINSVLLSSVLQAAQPPLLPPYDRAEDAAWNFRCDLPKTFNQPPARAWYQKFFAPYSDYAARKRIQAIEAALHQADAALALLEAALSARELYPFSQNKELTLAQAARDCKHYASVTGNISIVFEIFDQLASSRQSLFDLRETFYNLHGALYEAQGWSPYTLPYEFVEKVEARRSMLAGLGMIIRIATKELTDYIASSPSSNGLA
jgi:hypothetical protein